MLQIQLGNKYDFSCKAPSIVLLCTCTLALFLFCLSSFVFYIETVPRVGVATLRNNRLVQNNINVHVRPARTKYAWILELCITSKVAIRYVLRYRGHDTIHNTIWDLHWITPQNNLGNSCLLNNTYYSAIAIYRQSRQLISALWRAFHYSTTVQYK